MAAAAGYCELRRAVVRWYKSVAHDVLSSRVEVLAAAASLAPPTVRISPARTRWGSCNTRREIRLAWRLVKAPPDLVDYVICHELAHLKHMNHSRAFWGVREMPAYRICARSSTPPTSLQFVLTP